MISNRIVKKLLALFFTTFQRGFVDLNVMIYGLALACGTGVPGHCRQEERDRIPVPNKGGEVLTHHNAIHEIFHVVN